MCLLPVSEIRKIHLKLLLPAPFFRKLVLKHKIPKNLPFVMSQEAIIPYLGWWPHPLCLLFIHSYLQVLQFLDSFLAFLPVSCSVQPVKCERGPGATQSFSSALEKEALSLRDAASSLLSEEEEKTRKSPGHQETPGQTAAEGLQRCREGWQLDVERSKMRLSPLVDVDGYRRLTRHLLEVQLEADLAALSHAQRTLLS